MRVSVRGIGAPGRGYMRFPAHTHGGSLPPRGHPGARVCPGVFAEGSVPPLGWGDRGPGGLAEGDRRNCSQAPNTAVEISHDLPNATFYIL